MMKKIIIAAVASVAMFSANAQVKIGENAQVPPYDGVALEVSSGDNLFLGFKMPVVQLLNLSEWQLGPNPRTSDGKGSELNSALGTVVYNVKPASNPSAPASGLYVWVGSWQELKEQYSLPSDLRPISNGTSVIVTPPSNITTKSSNLGFLKMEVSAGRNGFYKFSDLIKSIEINGTAYVVPSGMFEIVNNISTIMLSIPGPVPASASNVSIKLVLCDDSVKSGMVINVIQQPQS